MENTHFATQTDAALVSELESRISSFIDYRKANYDPIWEHNVKLYYNRQFRDANNTSGIIYDGQRGELATVGVNQYRNILTHTVNLIIGTKPSFNAMAVNTDSKSFSQAKLANCVMEYYRKEKDLSSKLKHCLEVALLRYNGYFKVAWDEEAGKEFGVGPEGDPMREGDVTYKVLTPYEVVFDQNKRNFEDNEWIMTFEMRSRYDVAAQYPDLADKILKVDSGYRDGTTPNQVDLTASVETDDLQVWEFYHMKTAAVPDGKMVYFVGDMVLLDSELPYRDLPIYQLAAGRDLDSQFGYSVASDLVPIQEMINTHYSAINSNHEAFGTQKVAVARESNATPEEITGNLTFIHYDAQQGPAPAPLNLVQTPAEMFNMLNKLNNDMETVSGVNSVIRGEATQGVTSGTALALLQNQSIQFASNLQESYVKLAEDVSTATIRLLRDYANAPRIITIAGKHNRSTMQDFVGDDLANVDRVTVELGNPLSQTLAGRLSIAQDLLQIPGAITNSQKYLEVLETGSLTSLIENETSQLDLVRSENEFFQDGKQAPIMVTDDHALHIKEHAALLNSPDMRLDVNLYNLVVEHIWQHISNLNNPAIQQMNMILNHQGGIPGAPVPQPQGPQGAPGGGVNPGLVQSPNVAPTGPLPNLPNPAQPPAAAQPLPGIPQGPGPVQGQ